MAQINEQIRKLTQIVEKSQDKKLLWEEMEILSQRAFEVQDAIMAELDRVEAVETDITKVQAAFAAREAIWDMMDQITARELELKEKSHHKETEAERKARHKKIREAVAEEEEHPCCCGHHHAGKECGCGGHHHAPHHEHTEVCGCQKGKKTCKKK